MNPANPGTATEAAATPTPTEVSLLELACLFLRLGATSFGGPAAHIAFMEREVVRRLGWLSPAEFLDLMGATNLIPGPNSTEMAIHIGWCRARWAGLIVAGVCFIGPAALITLCLAWAYVRFGTRPEASALLYGVKPVIIAIVIQALWRLGRVSLRSRVLVLVAASCAIANALGGGEIAVLVAGGIATLSLSYSRDPGNRAGVPALFLLPPLTTFGVAGTTPAGLLPLFLFFLKVGSILYGSGHVLLAFLRSDLVERWGWLSDQQLLDAVAIGQLTPGPVFTTATFIGYLVGRLPGAGLATLGIFLPSFVFVAASGPLIPRLRRSRRAAAFLDGVNAASLSLMLVVTCELGRAALVDPLTIAVSMTSAVILAARSVNPMWLVLGGASVGLVRSMLM